MTIHPIGFTRLSDGGQDVVGKFNLVFIHGLRGHPQRTWEGRVKEPPRSRKSLFGSRKSQEDEGEGIFWPEVFLSKDIPKAMVWTYGYNANVIGMFSANNQSNVSQHGKDLAIAIERDIDNIDPIVFIVHSLGGIVLKDAIRRSEEAQNRTKFIMFLGTPHRGSPAADIGQLASNLARLALQDSNKDILRTLEINSEVLDNIHEGFVKIALKKNIVIHSFQESRGMSGIKGLSGKVVDNFSSKLDLPTVETVESIDADHRQMARCSSRDDETYRKVCGEIKNKIRKGMINGTRAPASTQPEELHYYMPFIPNNNFVGHEDIPKELERRLSIDKDAQRLASVGLDDDQSREQADRLVRSRLNAHCKPAGADLENKEIENVEELPKEITKIKSVVPKKNQIASLRSQCQQAKLCLDNGQNEKGTQILQKIVDISSTILYETDKDRLEFEYSLGRAYFEGDQADKAVKILEKVVKSEAEILLKTDKDRLLSQFWLGRAYLANDQTNKAVEELRKVVDIEANLLPETDEVRLNSQYWLGVALLINGEPRRAVSLLEKVVVAGHDSLDTRYYLGIAYLVDKQSGKAIETFEQLANDRSTEVENNKDLVGDQHWLAVAYAAHKQLDKAIPLMQQVLKQTRQIYGNEHRYTKESETELTRMIEKTNPSLPSR